MYTFAGMFSAGCGLLALVALLCTLVVLLFPAATGHYSVVHGPVTTLSEEYNLVLGTSRANAVKEELVRQGVDASRIKTVSYGKEKPFCTLENEECWQQNRRDHLVVQR